MHPFYTKDNLLFVYDIFDEYMQETYGIEISKIDTTGSVRKTIFSFMTDINGDPKFKHESVNDKNILLLSKAKQYYTKQLHINNTINSQTNNLTNNTINNTTNSKPNIQNLSRDKDIYKGREVIIQDKRPIADPYQRKSEQSTNLERDMLDKYQQIRDDEVGIKRVIPDSRLIAPIDKVMPESQDTFLQKVKELE